MLSTPLKSLLVAAACFQIGTYAQYAGNTGAVTACADIKAGTLKCLTDVSYTICNNGHEIEQFVAAGTYCAPGGSGGSDSILPGSATKTQIFVSRADTKSAVESTTASASQSIATGTAAASTYSTASESSSLGRLTRQD